MSFTKLKSVYKQRTGNTFDDTDYESFGLTDENGNLTNASALLAAYEEQVKFDETKMPVFDADSDDFILTLYNLNYGSEFEPQTNVLGFIK